MQQLHNIQAITFDVGGTMIDPWPSVGHVYAETAARHGVRDADPESLNRRFAEAWLAKPHFDYSRSAWADIVAMTFGHTGSSEKDQALFADLYERFARSEVWRIYDDVVPALEALRERGIRLGVVSNWDERLGPLLRRLKLDHYFECMIASAEIGHHKPSPMIFEHALNWFGLPAGAMLHVGDRTLEDVQGAQRAGWRALRIVRGNEPLACGEICTLMELLNSAQCA